MSQLSSSAKTEAEHLDQMPLTQHLMVLRQYLFKMVGVTVFLFSVYCPFVIIPISCCQNRSECSYQAPQP